MPTAFGLGPSSVALPNQAMRSWCATAPDRRRSGLRVEPENVTISTTSKMVWTAYVAVNKLQVTKSRKAAHWLVYGRLHPLEADMLHRLPFIRYHVLFPDLFRLRGRGRQVVAIDGEGFRRQVPILGDLIGLADAYEGAPFTHFRALRHTERVADVDGYVAEVFSWAQDVRDAGGRAAVKAHPRERNQQLLGKLSQSGASELPRDLPAEVITPLLSADCSISCGLSTFVLTSRLMLPNRRVILEDMVDGVSAERITAWDPKVVLATADPAMRLRIPTRTRGVPRLASKPDRAIRSRPSPRRCPLAASRGCGRLDVSSGEPT